jgi:hypothetical protein
VLALEQLYTLLNCALIGFKRAVVIGCFWKEEGKKEVRGGKKITSIPSKSIPLANLLKLLLAYK